MKTLGLSPHLKLKGLNGYSDRPLEPADFSILENMDKDEKNFEMEVLEGEENSTQPYSHEELDSRSRFRIISTSPSLDLRIRQNSCV